MVTKSVTIRALYVAITAPQGLLYGLLWVPTRVAIRALYRLLQGHYTGYYMADYVQSRYRHPLETLIDPFKESINFKQSITLCFQGPYYWVLKLV